MESILVNTVQELEQHLSDYQSGIDVDMHIFEIADRLVAVYNIEPEVYKNFLDNIPKTLLAEVLVELPKVLQEEFYKASDATSLANLTEKLDTDEAADLIQHIEEVDQTKATQILETLPDKEQEIIKELISYEENEAGAHMQVELFSADENETIGESIQRLKEMKNSHQIDNVHHVFVVSKHKEFLGMIPLEDLILHASNEYYRDILEEGKITVAVNNHEEIKKVLEISGNYDLSVIPVVNEHGMLLGRITSDDIHDLIEEEATGQIYNLAGVNDNAEQEESIWKIGKSRGVWLGVNLITAIVASFVIGLFDTTIQSLVALAILMPIVASMGGNAGTQTLTVTVRQMALGDIEADKARKTIFKEVLISVINGILYAVVMGIIAYVWFQMPMLGLVIAMAMVINLISAGFFGAVIPLGLQKFGIDPAIGSTVLLTTVTDVVGFFSFLGLATIILL